MEGLKCISWLVESSFQAALLCLDPPSAHRSEAITAPKVPQPCLPGGETSIFSDLRAVILFHPTFPTPIRQLWAPLHPLITQHCFSDTKRGAQPDRDCAVPFQSPWVRAARWNCTLKPNKLLQTMGYFSEWWDTVNYCLQTWHQLSSWSGCPACLVNYTRTAQGMPPLHSSHETVSHAQSRSCQHGPGQVHKTCLHCWQSLLVLANQQSFRCSIRRVPSYTLSLSDQFSARETPIFTLPFQRSAPSCSPRREQHREGSRPTWVHCTPGTSWHSTALAPGWPGSLPGICTLCFHPGWSPQQSAGSEGKSSWCNSPWHQIPRCILKRRTKLKTIF